MSSQASSKAQPAVDLETETSGADDADLSAGASDFAAALAKLGEAEDEDEAGDETGEEGTPREGGKKVKLDSLETLATSLGIEVKELYGIKVPGSGGREAMTIGQIKDRFQSFSSLEADRLSLTEERVKQEAEIEQARIELRELMSAIPADQLSQDKLRAVAARIAARNKADGKRLLEAMPEWQDEERREAEVADIAASLSKYGIPASWISTVRNPALLKFMRDAARREKQVQAALALVKKVPRKKVAAQPTGRTAPRVQPGQQKQRQPGAPVKPTSERERFTAALRQST